MTLQTSMLFFITLENYYFINKEIISHHWFSVLGVTYIIVISVSYQPKQWWYHKYFLFLFLIKEEYHM